MRARTWKRFPILVGAAALMSLPAFRAFAGEGRGVPFRDLQRQIAAMAERIEALEQERDHQQERIAALESLLIHFSRDGNEVTISGANLRVDNGTGVTDSSNGLGNVIVGYNESRATSPACAIHPEFCADDRGGSHMFVAGSYQNYSSYGGIVVGSLNSTSGAFASVCGGRFNEASGNHSSVGGGSSNEASGSEAAICGGSGNIATGMTSTVSGGAFNAASGIGSSVSGGSLNDASGDEASVCGGTHNEASGELSSISGGTFNEAKGRGAAISGGTFRFLETPFAWQAADLIRVDGAP